MVIDAIKPYARAVRYALKRRGAERAAARSGPFDQSPPEPAPGFVMGCGRSGTSVLGEILTLHPEVCYLFEPYHLWAAIDRRTDVTNFYHEVDGLFIMEARHASQQAKVRFNRLVHGARAASGRAVVIEKTPHNVCRIGYLDALAPGARYLTIVRSGLDVARSIDRLATRSSYKVAGKPEYNQWWGTNQCKWAALARDGAAAGYFAEEVGPLESHAQRGAYEWLVSLAEADRWRFRLGQRLLEITYPALTARPRETLAAICAHFGVAAEETWLREASAILSPERTNKGEPLRLPPRMAAAFNAQQERYGFAGRAESL
jgi:hypothetical protein